MRKSSGMAEAPAPPPALLPDLLSPAPPPRPLPAAEGHRARMRQRLLRAGPDSLLDHELIEMLLFLALPRRDTKALAHALLARFGSFGRALSAPPGALLAVEGLGEAGVAALKTAQAAALRLMRAELLDQPLLSSWEALQAYLQAAMGRDGVEQFRVLFLDARNRLIADEALGRGTVNHTPVYPREVVKRALELGATALILVHNHPSGDVTPSAADVTMTAEVRRAAEALGLVLHDHLIVGAAGCCSFRARGLL
ncbi:RadC family protein [Roseomonas sp. 18066]|uniref:RadC family protein n=1 Tax=Roseomonas sp. 18066 TaxID=2681412 RepID=UPI00135A6464|nr:DNA repair protein RadC [Roseomonas sp. 18066]